MLLIKYNCCFHQLSLKQELVVNVRNNSISNQRFQVKLYTILALLFYSSLALGHGDIHNRIAAVTEEIKIAPDSAFLFIKRGELKYQHEKYKSSIKDFKAAYKLRYISVRLDLDLARSYFKMNRYKKATKYADKVLQQNSDHVLAHRLKGQIFFAQKKYHQSANSYEKVIHFAAKAFPENYIEASISWEKANNPEANLKAEAIIQQGISDLGDIPSLYTRLIQLYNNRNDLSGIIAIQSSLIESANRKEFALYERAQTFIKMKKNVLAVTDLITAQNSIEKLNQRVKNKKNTVALASKIKNQLLIIQ